jgi:two-component system OmpR family sensor kinase
VLWYLGILALLLVALGVFQSVTLSSYLRSSTALSLRHSAYQELGVLGPCFIRSRTQLRQNAGTLARLLGGHDTAVMIVKPNGQTLASHGLGPPGASTPIHLSAATVNELIGQVEPPSVTNTPAIPAPCPRPDAGSTTRPYHRAELYRSLSSGNLLLVAVPLGPPGGPVGYAILGHTLQQANATITRLLLVFGLGALAALIIAALVALPIINRALRPLRRVTATAEAIAAGDLAQRAKLSHSPDEIGRLGEAFDTMVDRLESALSARAESEERMRRFLADASHEFRTPATVLRGATQVLLHRWVDGPPDLVSDLADLQAEAVRLSRLVDDLLTLSRIDSGQSLSPQPVELRPFLEEFVGHYGTAWPERTITLNEGRLDGACGFIDPEALRRILTNLVDNAARYSRPDGQIDISGDERDGTVSIAVADAGPGMSQEDAERIFDRFYRANKSRSRNSGGTGLGLAIVRGLVEQSGGTIGLDTGPERGTTVNVPLPRGGEDGEPEPAAGGSQEAAAPASARPA